MEHVTIAAAGDVSTGFDPPEGAFAHVLAPLRSADLRFAQVERVYSERGTFQEQAVSPHSRQHPRLASAFKSVPFDVLSIASNHTGDWGPQAAEDTAETFRLMGISTIGAGANLAAARQPAVFTRNGLRIAFLGYVSTTQPQYWATDSRAGSAPMRAHTFYEPYEFQPGAPARVVTVAHQGDLENLVQDVQQAKKNADLVVVSVHWGVHFTSRPCDYQPVVAHAAIDAGASAVLGHHAHQLQGIEIYRGCPIFYCIGNFSFWRLPARRKGHAKCLPEGEYTHQDVYSIEPDPGFMFDYRRHFDQGGIAFIDVDRLGVERVSFLPTVMNEGGQPEVVHPGEPQFEEMLNYLNWAGKFIAGGTTQITAAGDRYQVYARGGA